jgi:hypothetical protein
MRVELGEAINLINDVVDDLVPDIEKMKWGKHVHSRLLQRVCMQ